MKTDRQLEMQNKHSVESKCGKGRPRGEQIVNRGGEVMTMVMTMVTTVTVKIKHT